MSLLRNIWYSLPVQLVLLQLRRHWFLLIPWILLVLIVNGTIFPRLGWYLLFLDPEYFGSVSFASFYVIGLALGWLIFIWNVVGYILHSHRFPFLASFEQPFLRYSINNFFVPLVFLIFYFYKLIHFQFYMELKSLMEVLSYEAGLLSGMLTVLIVSLYGKLNVGADRLAFKRKPARMTLSRLWSRQRPLSSGDEIRVDYVLIHPFRVRHARKVKHYSEKDMARLFRMHHRNALILVCGALVLFIVLGYFQHLAFFRVPAAASILLLFSLVLAPIGALFFWLRSWAAVAVVVLLLMANELVRWGILGRQSQVFGWDYAKPVSYDLAHIEQAANPQQVQQDSLAGIAFLENWKKKVAVGYHRWQRPPLVVITASGGGLKAALWAFRINQLADSITGGRFFDHVVFISGASGGMIGEAFYRDLYLYKKAGDPIDVLDKKHLESISRDLLNSVSFTLVVNDLLYPWRNVTIDGRKYPRDRGYVLEQQLNENTGYLFRRRLSDYAPFEQQGISPMLVLSPAILNDGRRLLLSPMPVSYLASPPRTHVGLPIETDGIDAKVYFREQGGDRLLFTTSLRMNASFPYILPAIALPTVPAVQALDAGIRDNYGTELAVRFLYTFRHWIAANCSRVILLQVRGDFVKKNDPKGDRNPSLFRRLTAPLQSIYYNLTDFQDFFSDMLLSTAQEWLGLKLHVLHVEYVPAEKAQLAAVSLHMTVWEKNSVLSAAYHPRNQAALRLLAAWLAPSTPR
ncbi:MAG: hypothetical protein NZL95_04640 [Chitinophagales bacterium]|nr:hypothetical protein [Chitinophagales bacterium]MDW8427820.1 hypothetical protein [Chitinophagales bacterium]